MIINQEEADIVRKIFSLYLKAVLDMFLNTDADFKVVKAKIDDLRK